MQARISYTWLLVGIGMFGIALFSVFVFFPTLYHIGQYSYEAPVPSVSSQAPQDLVKAAAITYVQNAYILNVALPEPASFSLPVRLTIPEINIDSSVVYVGLTSDGTMDITKRPDDVSWFNLGPRPGEIGSAVIAGHYGQWKNGAHSIFDNLHTLKAGDKIYVEDDSGTTVAFVVRETRRYNPDADASAVFESHDGKSHLNLITCDGVWNTASESYSQRLVVFTDRETDQ